MDREELICSCSDVIQEKLKQVLEHLIKNIQDVDDTCM